MAWSRNDSCLDFSDFEFPILNNLNYLKLVCLSFCPWSHDDWHFELGVSSQEISMIMGQHNIFQYCPSFVNEFFEDQVIICRINQICLSIWFNIICENSKHFSLKLNNINTFFSLFGYNFNVTTHEIFKLIGKNL